MHYFLPVAAGVFLALALVTWLALEFIGDLQAQSARTSVQGTAEALSERIGGFLAARRELLGLVTRSSTVRRALEGGEAETLKRIAQAAAALLPGALQLRLFPQMDVAPDPRGKAPMGFAGVDMVRRALQGKHPPAEIHQIMAGRPYLGMALPIEHDKRVVGAAFVAWPLSQLRPLVSAPNVPGVLWLVQGEADGYVIASSGTGHPPAGAESVAVPGSIWRIFYQVTPRSTGEEATLLLATAGGALLLVLGLLFVRQQALVRDLRYDMAALVALGEAIQEGHGAGEHVPRTSMARDAMLLLSGMAKRAYGKGAAAREKPQPVVVADKPKRAQPRGGEVRTGIEVRETHQRMPVKVAANIFRAYDVRGLAGKELTPEVAQGLGWALAEMAQANGVSRVYVAHDPRLSSADLYEAMIDGLAGQGMQVIELGMGPVALLYHAMHQDPESAAVMVTGSHNPPEYNGFKLYLRTEPIQGEQLLALRERMLEGGFEPVQGAREQRDVRREYLDAVVESVTLGRPLKVVVDAGNGAAGELACALFEMLGCEVTPLYCEPDGQFPHHHPDPSRPENLEDLRREVVARNADLGVAFDGDGDRIGVVDDRGGPVWPEHLLMLLAADVLRRHPGVDVIYDVKSSRYLAGFILSNGGRPIMWRSGHSLMKAKMRESGALIGGEFSGHIYIKERWSGSDDAIYVAVRLLEVFADDPRPVHEQVAELPYGIGTPEYQLHMSEGEPLLAMQSIMAAANFPDARVVDLDGLRIEFDDAWGLVRPSNTMPSLVFRFEADSPAALETIKQRFRELMQQALPDRDLPF
ncbi:hypothetical protein [endosymbiont of unidentified scaly snail isolate Monju]|uniref:hypothetical protein n=1 Tax=endosymbiont of unidentified scaly snail isolate Monju TaxID=1248727 RepID=UPI000A47CA26|nr:hypothetical protein [endosymbiont of unidentified scaly snail isolate Monju]